MVEQSGSEARRGAARIRSINRERVDEGRVREIGGRVIRRVAGLRCGHSLEVGQHDRQRTGAGARACIPERTAAAGSDVGLQRTCMA